MKRLLLLIVVILISGSAFCQNDFATITIFKKTAPEASFYLDGKLMGKLRKGHLEYKVYNLHKAKITITNNQNYTNEIIINLQKDGVYNLEVIQLKPSYKGYTLEAIGMQPADKVYYENVVKGDDKDTK
ncbi:MAG: hypothetical protein ACM3ME_00760 [Chloroflexota bacterium]|nr:hypothetical protein [Lentimicrobium sp.]